MRLEDMSFTDYLMDEFYLRERQRKERMKQAEFEKYAKEHNIFYCTKELQEPKTGHWEFLCQHWRKCSECGFSHKFAEDWNYCPNCGARMVEQRESEVRNETDN